MSAGVSLSAVWVRGQEGVDGWLVARWDWMCRSLFQPVWSIKKSSKNKAKSPIVWSPNVLGNISCKGNYIQTRHVALHVAAPKSHPLMGENRQEKGGWTLATHSDRGVDCWLVPPSAPPSSGTAAHCTQLVAQTYYITFTQPAALGAALHVTPVAAGRMHGWRELPRRLTATYANGFPSPLAHQRLLERLMTTKFNPERLCKIYFYFLHFRHISLQLAMCSQNF